MLRFRLEKLKCARGTVNLYGLFQIEIAECAQNARSQLRVRRVIGHLDQVRFFQRFNLQFIFKGQHSL